MTHLCLSGLTRVCLVIWSRLVWPLRLQIESPRGSSRGWMDRVQSGRCIRVSLTMSGGTAGCLLLPGGWHRVCMSDDVGCRRCMGWCTEARPWCHLQWWQSGTFEQTGCLRCVGHRWFVCRMHTVFLCLSDEWG